MCPGWEGEKVRLVPLDKAKHLENALNWLNDPEVTQWTLIGDFPLTRLAEEDFFEKAMRSEQTQAAFAVETREGEHIGFCGIDQIDWRNGVGVTGTIIGRKDLWRQGYGSDTVAVRTRYAFEALGLRMLLSEVLGENVASLKALKKVGYREVGRIPGRYWKRGAYRDRIQLMIDRETWLARTGSL